MGLTVNIGPYSGLPLNRVRMTTHSPGGCGELTGQVELPPPYLGLLNLREGGRVDAFDAFGLVWRGRLEERRVRLEHGAGQWQFTALGYAASARDQFYTSSTTFAAGTAIETILTTARDDLCPDISTSNAEIVATNRTLSATSADMVGNTAQDVWDLAAQIGNSADERLYWHVWPGTPGAANNAELEVIARPSAPEYFVGLDQGAVVDLSWSLSCLYNRVTIRWGSIPTYTTVNDLPSQSDEEYGIVRALLMANDLINSATDATNAANSLLAHRRHVTAVSREIVLASSTPILGPGGALVPPQRVRAGRMIRVRDLRAGAQRTQEHDFFIAATEWDEDAQSLRITPESPEHVTNLLGRILRQERLT